jgi:hypothetical protein
MTEHLEEQLVNELRAKLQELNEKYKDFYHFDLLTLVDLDDESCVKCTDNITKPKCMRSVIGVKEDKDVLE